MGATQGLHRIERLIDEKENLLTGNIELLASPRQLRLASDRIKKLHPKRLFAQTDLRRDGWLTKVQLFGCPDKAAMLRHNLEGR